MRNYEQEAKDRAQSLLGKKVTLMGVDYKVVKVDGIYCLCEHISGNKLWTAQGVLKEVKKGGE